MTRSLTLLAALACSFQAQADRGWHKLSRENCAGLLEHLRPKALTVDNILDELDAKSRGLIKDCGPGCYEYEDWSSKSIPVQQAENERKVAAAYAESLLIKNEGLFLFSRYNGIDVPAWDGLTFELDTGVVTSKVSLKRAKKVYSALQVAFDRAHRYSVHGGEWSNLAANRVVRYPPQGMTWEQAGHYSKNNFDRIARWLLADDERVRTRVVLQHPEPWPMPDDLPAYARQLLLTQPSSEVESVILIDGEITYRLVDKNSLVTLSRSRRGQPEQ